MWPKLSYSRRVCAVPSLHPRREAHLVPFAARHGDMAFRTCQERGKGHGEEATRGGRGAQGRAAAGGPCVGQLHRRELRHHLGCQEGHVEPHGQEDQEEFGPGRRTLSHPNSSQREHRLAADFNNTCFLLRGLSSSKVSPKLTALEALQLRNSDSSNTDRWHDTPLHAQATLLHGAKCARAAANM